MKKTIRIILSILVLLVIVICLLIILHFTITIIYTIIIPLIIFIVLYNKYIDGEDSESNFNEIEIIDILIDIKVAYKKRLSELFVIILGLCAGVGGFFLFSKDNTIRGTFGIVLMMPGCLSTLYLFAPLIRSILFLLMTILGIIRLLLYYAQGFLNVLMELTESFES